MNHYQTSTGERVSQSQIDYRIRQAKAKKVANFFDEHSYYHCEECKRSSGSWFDCSHIVSVKEAKESGKTELCWDVNNITLLCRSCHTKRDNLNLQYANRD